MCQNIWIYMQSVAPRDWDVFNFEPLSIVAFDGDYACFASFGNQHRIIYIQETKSTPASHSFSQTVIWNEENWNEENTLPHDAKYACL